MMMMSIRTITNNTKMKQQQGALLKHRLLLVDCVIRLRPGTFDAHIITKCLGLFYLVLAISTASQCNAPKERTFRTCNEIIAQHTKSLFVRRCLHIECMGLGIACMLVSLCVCTFLARKCGSFHFAVVDVVMTCLCVYWILLPF